MSDAPARPLADQATARIRADILACTLAPGMTLSETMLVAHTGHGRAPIRAALARLGDEGLVQALPRRGWVVSQVSIRDVHDVFDLRQMLQPETARRAATSYRAGDPAAARLSSLADTCMTATGTALVRADRDFHTAVALLGGNRRLAHTITGLLDDSQRMLNLCLGLGRGLELKREHAALLAALVDHDGQEAAAIMAECVATTRGLVLSALTGPGSPLTI